MMRAVLWRVLSVVFVLCFQNACIFKKTSGQVKSEPAHGAQIITEADLDLYSSAGQSAANALVHWEQDLYQRDAESDIPLVPSNIAMLGRVRLRLGARDGKRVSEHPYFLDDEQAQILRSAALMAIARLDPRRNNGVQTNFFDACNKADILGPGKKLLKPMLCWQGFNKDAMAYLFRKGEFNFDQSSIDSALDLLDVNKTNPEKRVVQFEFYVEPIPDNDESSSSAHKGNHLRQVMLVTSSATKGVARFFFNDTLESAFQVVIRPDSLAKKLVTLNSEEFENAAGQKADVALTHVTEGKFDDATRQTLKKVFGIRKDEDVADIFSLSETFRRQQTMKTFIQAGTTAALGTFALLSVPVLVVGPQSLAAGFLATAAAHTGNAATISVLHAGFAYASALVGFFGNTVGALQVRQVISDWGAGKSRQRALTALTLLDQTGLGLSIAANVFIVPDLLRNAARYLYEFFAWRDVVAAHVQATPQQIQAAVEKAWEMGGADIVANVQASLDAVKNSPNPVQTISQLQLNQRIVQLCADLGKRVLDILKSGNAN